MDVTRTRRVLRVLFWGVLLAVFGINHPLVDSILHVAGLAATALAGLRLAATWPRFRLVSGLSTVLMAVEVTALLGADAGPPVLVAVGRLLWFALLLTAVAEIPRPRRPELANQITWVRNASLAAFLAALVTQLTTESPRVLEGLLYYVILGLMIAAMIGIHHVIRALPVLLRQPPDECAPARRSAGGA